MRRANTNAAPKREESRYIRCIVTLEATASQAIIHPSAEVEPGSSVGEGTRVWHLCQIRAGAQVGRHCVLGRGVFIDAGVRVGDGVKIQNYVSVYHGVTLERGVYVGPHVCFTNDRLPRAVNPDFSPKGVSDWTLTPTTVREGASIGANVTVVCGVTVGRWALVGAGSVVTRDIPDYALAVGGPARPIGWVCACGRRQPSASDAARCMGCGPRDR
jgi:acetyltransferase-like isoleucine patch superfamily enzyme